jgi:hypothetical protein
VASIKQLLNHAILGKQTVNIKNCLKNATIAYNVSPNESLDGLSPFFVYFGRDYTSGLDSTLQVKNPVYEPTHIVAKNFKKDIEHRNSLIKKAHLLIKSGRKFDHDSKMDEMSTFLSGDEVLLDDKNNQHNEGKGRKCSVKRKGPFIVIMVIKNLAILADKNGGILRDMVNIRRLSHAKNLDNSFPADSNSNELICNITATNKSRTRNGRTEHLYYPKSDDGNVYKKSAFWW